MTRWRPVSGSVGSGGTNSVATAAARTRGGISGSSDDGHSLGLGRHLGPCCQSVQDIKISVVVPLERRSAGFSGLLQAQFTPQLSVAAAAAARRA